MSDLREYGFGDWYKIFVKAIPAYLLATIIVFGLPFALLALAWFLVAIPG